MIKYLLLILISTYTLAETRQKIVVIDTGISFAQSLKPYMCKNGKLSTSNDWKDVDGHGTNIVGLIGDRINPKKTCVVSIKLDLKNSKNIEMDVIKSMLMAENLKPVGVNISMAGNFSSRLELLSIVRMISSGVKVIVAAGNEGVNLDRNCYIYPACYLAEIKKEKKIINISNFIVVGAKDVSVSNTGSVVTVTTNGSKQGFPVMSGTSQATANFTGKLFSK
jgi:subtilisin family serine protease